ncbi:MAG: hypothetical protein LZF86_10096 [Nitrospira sp.]|nr:MAG: hypothetical protein LZF86_10096 [Nitrospira sp.]
MDASRPNLFQSLIDELGKPREFSATYSFSKEPGVAKSPDSILISLGIESTLLSSIAKETLDALDAPDIETQTDWLEFKWRLQAFNFLQDIFDAPFLNETDLKTIFHQYYFYFESRQLLSESILCGLNGFYTAALALLRPFLEFSLLQNYFYRITEQTNSYSTIEKYFKTGIVPSWGTVLKNALPKDSFSQTIRFRVHTHLTGLSESVAHPYHPDHSASQHKNPGSSHSLEGIYFWQMTRFAVEAALWLYYTNFPLLFHPVSTLRKFGYRWPVGIFIDERGGAIIKKSLAEDDYQKFATYSLSHNKVLSTLEWVNNLPILSDTEILATWDQEHGDCPGLWNGYAQEMARMRVLRGAMALRNRPQRRSRCAAAIPGRSKVIARMAETGDKRPSKPEAPTLVFISQECRTA